MARYRRNKGINLEGLRKKCSTCGKIKQVEHRKLEIPMRNNNYNPKEQKKAVDLPGVVVYHYCSLDCAPGDVSNWTDTYTEEDFYRI